MTLALPEERLRIRALLEASPEARETKVDKLLSALGALWRQNASERVVIFATYLGTVDLLGREIEAAYPGQGVAVLRGGDHGAKLAAERKFRQNGGPKVLVCTAAGREGINLQFARVLFNFDLPWNPMDVEQRIGRIHRYGQHHTAQVYNLVLSDTIEGKIFLLLDEKLMEIARTLGKVDERGNVAEDLRSQILGQLSERLSYDRLYQEALSDPELRRTRFELEAALSNASEARKVVFELFQDLEGFSLEDYKPFADIGAGMDRLVRFLGVALEYVGLRIVGLGDGIFEIRGNNGSDVVVRFTTRREVARERADVELMGLDHILVEEAIARARLLPPEEIGAVVRGNDGDPGILTWWLVHAHSDSGERSHLQAIAVQLDGTRKPALESRADAIWSLPSSSPFLGIGDRLGLLHQYIEPMLRRDLLHRGVISEHSGFSAELVGWIEIAAGEGGGAAPRDYGQENDA